MRLFGRLGPHLGSLGVVLADLGAHLGDLGVVSNIYQVLSVNVYAYINEYMINHVDIHIYILYMYIIYFPPNTA